jgi:hypothetical protein
VEDSCEHGDERSGSLKCWEVLEWLQNFYAPSHVFFLKWYNEKCGIMAELCLENYFNFDMPGIFLRVFI